MPTRGPVKAFVDLVEKHKKPSMVVAEVGVFDGDTASSYLPIVQSQNGKAILIDWFLGNKLPGEDDFEHHDKGKREHDQILGHLKSVLENIQCMDIVTILDMSSDEAALQVADESLDICFIDAAHTYSQCLKDIKNYLPKVKSGGILCGHDCEGFELVGTFTPEQLESEWFVAPPGLYVNGGCHPGVIQAVFDNFGKVELLPDGGIHRIPVWLYMKP